MSGINLAAVDELPIAVVDVETTGLHPGGDRIIEIAVARIEPDGEPEIVFDSLVNPERPVAATEVHGITDDDVRDAPTFREVAPAVAAALDGAVFAAYNVYFDVRFVRSELNQVGTAGFPPYLCLMYLRPLLGIGKRCTLDDACRQHALEYQTQHVAADDALVSARLWVEYLDIMRELEIRTFGDLARRKSYKFTKSFADHPLALSGRPVSVRRKSRWRPVALEAGVESSGHGHERAIHEYWEALKAVLSDLEVTRDEIAYLQQKRREFQLSNEVVRSLHARAFCGILGEVSDDHLIVDEEVDRLAAMADALRDLGWAPGDPVAAPDVRKGRRNRGFLARLFGS